MAGKAQVQPKCIRGCKILQKKQRHGQRRKEEYSITKDKRKRESLSHQ